MIQPDLFAAKAARDAGMARVKARSKRWVIQAIVLIGAIPADTIVTGEDIRLRCTNAGVTPIHPNAWGSMIGSAIRLKLIEPTGKHVSMQTPKSHARMTPEYRRTADAG